MFVWSTVLLTVAATSDSFAIGFNYGVKGVRINYIANLYISMLCFAGTFLSMLAGNLLGEVINGGTAALIGGVILIGLGLYMLCGCLKKQDNASLRDPDRVDKDRSKVIELRESAFIGLLLSLNNMGLGIGAGFAGLPVLLTSALCAGASFGFISAGFALGRRMTRLRLGKLLELGSSLLVILLGTLELVG